MTTALLLAVLAKATVILVLALAGTWLARKSRAAVRHLLLMAAFGALIGLPVASILAPAVRVSVTAPIPSAAPDDVTTQIFDAFTEAPAIARPEVTSQEPSASRPSLATVAIAVWVCGLALFLVPVMTGLWQVRALRRSALPWRDRRATIDEVAVGASVRRRVDVLLHESVPGPMTCGVRHPVIVLPIDAPAWPTEDLHRALVHELEHVRRADWVSHCAARVVAACYWFHPIVWIASRRLALEAERACDDAVLRASEATAYADQLVMLARRLSASDSHPQLAMADRRDLATRVLSVLDSRQPRGRAGARWIAVACVASTLVLATVSPLRIVAAVQAPIPASAKARATFDAATIKPCQAEENPTGARGGAGGTNATISPGRFFVPCVTTEQLIYLAYAGSGARPDEWLVNDSLGGASDASKVRGGPDWVHSYRDKFAIEATAAAGVSDRTVLMGSMLRTLLEERFHLKVHRESEEVPMYALMVAKNGFKLKPMKDGECDADETKPFELNPVKPRCSSVNTQARGPNMVWTFGGSDVSSLAGRLSRPLGRHVIDQTGITGEFILRLEFHPDGNTPGLLWPPEREADTSAPQAPTIFTALEAQLGLKIEKTKGPRGFLVIDHVERPDSAASAAASGRPLSEVPTRAQGAGQPTAVQAPPQKFAVASIKPCESVPVVPGGRTGGSGHLESTPGTLNVTCMTVAEMVSRAYVQYGNPPPPFATGLSDADGIRGGPAWARSDKYSIEAKADGAASLTTMAGAMLRAVLEDRFQLKIHQDVKDVPAIAITVAPGGLKMKPIDPASCTQTDPDHPGPRIMGADGLVRTAAGEKPLCVGGFSRHGANSVYAVTGLTLDRVARTLSGLLFTRPVVDQTGLSGQFSFSVEFAPDETMRPMPLRQGEAALTPDGPSFFSVFEKQLGLKLVPAKAKQGVLVIDSVQRPKNDLEGLYSQFRD